jgi:hypothetical protein
LLPYQQASLIAFQQTRFHDDSERQIDFLKALIPKSMPGKRRRK